MRDEAMKAWERSLRRIEAGEAEYVRHKRRLPNAEMAHIKQTAMDIWEELARLQSTLKRHGCEGLAMDLESARSRLVNVVRAMNREQK